MRVEVYPEYVRVITNDSGTVSIGEPEGHRAVVFHNAEQAHSWLCNHSYLLIERHKSGPVDGLYRRPGGAV